MTLIPATLADAQDIFQAIQTNRDSLRTWLPFVDDTQTIDDSIAFLKYTETLGDKLFTIRHECAFAGLIGLKSIDNTNKKAEIGYWIIPAMEGKGLVTRSCQQLIEMAFNELGLNRVLIQVALGNERSRKIPIRLGFKEEGVERDGELLVSGYTDIVKYGLLKRDVIKRTEINLKLLQSEDISLFEKWLDKEYIYKRLCPDGEEQRKAWLDEVTNRDGKYNFLSHFIVYHNDRKIGYCLYADCFFLKNLEEEGHDFEDLYGDVTEENHTYEIGYLIGEEEYLNKGISKIVIQQLEEKILELGGHEIAADPSEENNFSVKALLSNGFKKKKDGDYRKVVTKSLSIAEY